MIINYTDITMLFSICYLIKSYLTPEKLIDYLSEQNYFILTGELFVHHIVPNLNLADLYTLTRVCKFYFNNNNLRKIIKNKRIEHYLNILNGPISITKLGMITMEPDKEVVLKYKNILEILNPLLFTNQITLKYNSIYFGPTDSNAYWLRIDVQINQLYFTAHNNRNYRREKLEDLPAELIVALKESTTADDLVYRYANYYDIYCRKQWISDNNKRSLIEGGILIYMGLIAGAIEYGMLK